MSAAHRPRRGTRLHRACVCCALLAAAALALPAGAAYAADPTASPSPSATASGGSSVTTPLPELLTQLQTLYQQAETATEAYDAAEEQLTAQRGKAERLDRQLADERTALADARAQAGLLANRQYQNGGLSSYMNLLLSDDPQELFSQNHFLQRAAGNQQDVIEQLTAAQQQVALLSLEAQHALDTSQQLERKRKQAKKTVEGQLAAVEQIVSTLTGAQLSELQELEQKGIAASQKEFLASEQLGSSVTDRAPSKVGDRAIRFAYAQLGKPYVWGAEGPKAYDCSGLTSKAWASAGVTIPRTSEEQWAQLPHVPLNLLRPGDLVIYFAKASHVALYLGNGLVIEAPRPGGVVQIEPIAANPILGAVRPDSDEAPMAQYTAPDAAATTSTASPIGGESSL